ncbi:MAG: acyl-CoA dehydrogenase family protein [Candidatus Nanopelagicales bacterium]|nr:acyl-CoA dehydrogenase family protein [Candidatus Nanopelagicales bacterium]
MAQAPSTGGAISPTDLYAIDSLLADEHRDVRDTVRRFADERIRPHVAGWFEAGDLPARELARELGGLGVLGMHLEGYGCAGTDATSYGLACLELEAADSGIRSLVSVQGSLAMYAIHAYGSDEQRERWLPGMARGEHIGCFGLTEPDAGSDPGSMRTTAVRAGGDWVLRGTKTWITNGTVADVAVVWAKVEGRVHGFLVPTDSPGFTARPIPHKLSLRASVTAELALDDVRLPGDALLPGGAGLSAPLGCLAEARYGIVFGAVGAARECLEAALAYAAAREQFGRPIAGFQLTQRKLAEMAVAVGNGHLLALHLGRLKDAGRLTPQQVSVGKFHNVAAALQVAREARALLGGNGISLEYPVIRHMTNLESVFTYEGTHDIHTLVIGEALTGIPAYR